MTNKYGDNRHQEHMFSLHGTADTSKFSLKSGMEINIETLLTQNGATAHDAAETATAVFKGLQRYKDNPPEKQAEFVSMMISPLLKDKGASFTDKPDPKKLDSAVNAIMGMAERSFSPRTPASSPAAPAAQTAAPQRPKTP